MRARCRIALGIAAIATSVFAGVEFTRTESGALPVGNRSRKLGKTLIFAERQIYGPGVNVLHEWQDRPLFHDSGLRANTAEMSGFKRGFFRDVDILQSAGFDGFGAIAHHHVNEDHLRLLKIHPKPGYLQMPIICPSMGGVDFNEGVFDAPGFKAVYEREKRYLIACAKSPYTLRIDGKVVVWTYGGDEAAMLAWAKRMREDPDLPPFVLMGQMPFMDMYTEYSSRNAQLRGKGSKKVAIQEEKVAAYRSKVKELAALTGGLQVWCVNRRRDWDGEYPVVTEATPIYRDYIAPTLERVVAMPGCEDILVGAYLRQGYINKFQGTTDGQYGTATLRAYLDEISALNPDILMCFEWNEQNENTFFQPTVAHARTWARILAFYRSRLDGMPPQPMPGDDVTVPNLIVSVRQALKLGEPYHLELLYLPDGTCKETIVAQIVLKDDCGRVVSVLPEERIPPDALKAIDYRIASEQLTGCLSVTPELTVRGCNRERKFTGFDSTRIRPTRALDYLYSHCPLRDMFTPKQATLLVEAAGEDRVYRIKAEVSADEELAQVEVLDGLEEVAAADSDNWFDNEAYALFRMKIETVVPELFGAGDSRNEKGIATFENAPHAQLRESGLMWETFGNYGPTAGGIRVNLRMCERPGCFFVRVPRAEIANARMRMDFPRIGRIDVNLEQVETMGRIDHDAGRTVTVSCERLDDLADIPKPLGVRAAGFSRKVRSMRRFPQFQLRAITKSGRVYRSAIQHPIRPALENVPLRVFSESVRRPVIVSVPRDSVPTYDYSFSPAHGTLISSGWDRSGDGTLGGGSISGMPMARAKVLGKLPNDFGGATAAKLVQENGEWMLSFDKGSYFIVPKEVVPGAAEFALDFEFRPRTVDDQVLLRSSNSNAADEGLQLLIKNGTLHVSYYGIHFYRPPDFDTKAQLVPGKWNSVRIVRRFERIECIVNGVKTSFPWDRRARHFSGCVFGSNVQPNNTCPTGIRPFAGELRRFKVSHLLSEDR